MLRFCKNSSDKYPGCFFIMARISLSATKASDGDVLAASETFTTTVTMSADAGLVCAQLESMINDDADAKVSTAVHKWIKGLMNTWCLIS